MNARWVRASSVLGGVVALLLLAATGTAQPPGYGPKTPMTDPTVPSPKLKDVLTPPKAVVATKAESPKDLALKLRGRIIVMDRAIVVLEMNGLMFELPVGGEGNGVKVKEITPTKVVVEVGNGKEIKVLY